MDVERLLQEGANPNGYKFTPLATAIVTGQPEMVEVLLRTGADINGYNSNYGELFKAAIKTDNDVIVRLFIQYGANINKPNDHGVTALHYAASECKINAMSVMVSYSPDFSKLDYKNETPIMIAERLEKEKQTIIKNGYTPSLPNWNVILDLMISAQEQEKLESSIDNKVSNQQSLGF